MVNQLIQKPNRPPIKKTEQEVIYQGINIQEKRLGEGFTSADYQVGLKAYNKLKSEHDSLKLLFENKTLGDSIVDIPKIQKLTDSLYSQGLRLLTSALDSVQQLGNTNAVDMELEVIELEKELENCSDKLKLIIEERIGKNKKSLETVKGYRDRIDEYICQAGLCRDSIREIRLELPELMSHKPQDEYDKLILELNTRIAFAQRVKVEYDKRGL
jgi:hypothetical protein